MKIIIVGAGVIGSHLAASLSQEKHEVYLIECREDVASRIDEKIDAKVIVGRGSDPDILHQAGVATADLVIAVTNADEVNLVVCSLAARFGAKRRIARVRHPALLNAAKSISEKQFYVDEFINPEEVAAFDIIKAVQAPGAREVADFAESRILLRSFDLLTQSPMCGHKMEDLRSEDFPWPFLIVAVIRDGEVIIPKGDTSLQAKDRIYALLPAASLGEFLMFLDPQIRQANKIVIYGANHISEYVIRELSATVKNIVLIEPDPNVCEDYAGRLEAARVINGSASEAAILKECAIETADAFIATTAQDHTNLVSAVLAKKMGAKRTIITTQQQDYLRIIDTMDIDVVINPQLRAVDQILRLVRGKGIRSVINLLECDCEAIEFVPEDGSPVTKAPLRRLSFPKNSIVGAVIQDQDVVLANGDTHIKPGERVIVFGQEKAVRKIQGLFTRRQLF